MYWIILPRISPLGAPRGGEMRLRGGGRRVEGVGSPGFYFPVMPLSGSFMIAGSFTLVASTARAQATTVSGTDAANQETGLTEIVVTARKRVETMQSIPESIGACAAQE